MKLDLSVIILTYNEEIHIDRCIESVSDIADTIYVVDSYSTDNTLEIARSSGAIVYQNKWENNYAKQFNWALNTLPIGTSWVLRLDADEYVTTALREELTKRLPNLKENISGVELPFKRVFLGRPIYRGTGGIKMLRIFRHNKAICESRWMDEHMQVLEGATVVFENEFVDDNLNDLSWWTQKHVGYAIREAVDLLDIEMNIISNEQKTSDLSHQAAQKRILKQKYARQPLFIRSFIYFLYRYIFKLGFLEGKEGFLWHFLQGWWYRTLVDAKILEIKRACGDNPERIKEYIKTNYGLEL